MKKITKFLFVVILIICLSGCIKKTERITCIKTYIDYKYILDEKIIIIFNNNKPTNMDMYVSIELDKDLNEEEKNNIKFNITNELDKYKNEGVRITKEGRTRIINLDMNFNLKKINKDNIEFLRNFSNKNETLNILEKEGYTCK